MAEWEVLLPVWLQVAFLAFATNETLRDFVSLLSMTLLGRFGPQWKDAITAEHKAGLLTAKQVVSFVLAWPNGRTAERLGGISHHSVQTS